MPDSRLTPAAVSGSGGVVPVVLPAAGSPITGPLDTGTTGYLFNVNGTGGQSASLLVSCVDNVSPDGHITWCVLGGITAAGHDMFLEIGQFPTGSESGNEEAYCNIGYDVTTGGTFQILKTRRIGDTAYIAFFNATPVVQQAVTGSRGGRASTTSLLAALGASGYNFLTDSTTLGVALSRQIFATHASSQTYTTPTNCAAIIVECVGAGGAGGGVATVTSDANIGQAGGGGAYSVKIITAPAATYTYTVGTGGTPGSAGANPGGAGGDTSFIGSGPVTLCLAKGGNGGAGTTALAGANLTIGATGGSAGSGVGDLLLSGESGFGGTQTGVAVNRAGMGGSAAGPYGSGGAIEKITTGTGNSTTLNGGGGGGGVVQSGSASVAGGSGGDGLIVVTEFY